MSSLKMTFSLTSLILIIALGLVFVPISVMAHVDSGDATHQPGDSAGTDHGLVKSVTADKTIVGENDIVSVTVEYAPSVLATTTPARHATTIDTALTAITELSFMIKNDDGEFVALDAVTPAATNPLALQGNVITLRAPVQAAEGATAVGGLYRLPLIKNVANGTNGVYQIGIPSDTARTDKGNTMGTVTVTVDSEDPMVSNIRFEPATGKNYPQNDVWTEAFMVKFDAMDSVSGLAAINKSALTATPANLTFSDPVKVGSNTWASTATPVVTSTADSAAVNIDIKVMVMDKAGNDHSLMKMAMLKRPAGTPATTATTLDTTETTTTLAGSIAANKFMVIESANLPDIAEFFRVGGTIELMDPADGTAKKWDVVISEIMWGYDHAAPIAMQDDRQFIELYNTTGSSISLAGWMLKFNSSRTVPAIDVDQVSNVAGAGWIVDVGQSGRWKGTSNELSTNTALPTNIISMYRNIDYKKVEKTDHNKDDAAKNREEQLKGVPDGNAKGSWKASTRAQSMNGIYESKNRQHYAAGFAVRTPSSVAGKPFIISEIGNDEGSANDWVELQNVSDTEQSVKNYALTKVTAKGTDTEIFDFKDQDWKVPAGRFVVISTRHPRDTDLAAGKDISIADDDEENSGASHLFVVKPVDLPDNGEFALILRNAHDKEKKAEALIDVVATRKGAFKDDAIGTSLWPLVATGLPHDNVIDGGDEVFAKGKVYQRNSGNGRGEKQFAVRGYTGIGYDRAAAATGANGGTPGYHKDSLKDKIAGLTDGSITISEIMVDTGEARQSLAQWIELHNSSMTQAVSLNGWKLHIENAANGDGTLETNTFSATLTLGDLKVAPNQTVLIASTTGRVSDPDHFPSTRVINLWTTKAHRDALEMVRRTDPILSTIGFNIKLVDKDNNPVDAAGNLDGNRRTRDEPAWMLPMSEDDGRRSSLLRIYDDGVAIKGTMKDAWVSADATNLAFAISQTYYGDPDDFGTPGFKAGGPLPVSLSKFRPERLKDTGEVVVRWITESELNNAGFNILRSEKRDGEFTKVHFEAGEGTTSERTVYEWKDKSAKPNVVYYYQIQDVSLDGDVTTLRVTHLRGNVTAAGKLTTTWGEIKALQ